MERVMMWDSTNLVDLSKLPPDLTPSGRRRDRCWRVEGATSPLGGFGCTRIAGHQGRHAAGDGSVIRAVWPRERTGDRIVNGHWWECDGSKGGRCFVPEMCAELASRRRSLDG